MHKDTKLSINPDELSPVALEVWDWLDEESRENIQKKNPFIIIRNKEIFTLSQKGIQQRIIVELTGISNSAVSRVVQKFKAELIPQTLEMISVSDINFSFDEIKMRLKDLNKELIEIKTAIQSDQGVSNERNQNKLV